MKKVIIAVAIGLALVAAIITFGQLFTVRYVSVEFVNAVTCANKEKILDLADISTHTNIFMLDEKKITASVQDGFPEHEIRVNDIVREFPNKVTIKVSERIALYKIEVDTGEEKGYVTADRGFQRNTIYSSEEALGIDLITVNGFKVENSFNISECYILRDIASGLIECGIEEEALTSLIDSINFHGTEVEIRLKTTDTCFMISNNKDLAYEQIISCYTQYEAIDYKDRVGIILTA